MRTRAVGLHRRGEDRTSIRCEDAHSYNTSAEAAAVAGAFLHEHQLTEEERGSDLDLVQAPKWYQA